MRMNRTRLIATDIVAPPVAPDRLAEYRRFGYVSDLTMSASVVRAARQWGSQPAIIEGGQPADLPGAARAGRTRGRVAGRGGRRARRRGVLADA